MTHPWKPQPPRVVIVGGGLAGLAVASCLVERGLQITLVESRPRLGGRASSFTDPATGELVDNCQHVSMTCCTNLANFSRRVGIDGLFRRDPGVLFLDEKGQPSRLAPGPLPAPFHLTGSFLTARYLTLAERARVAWGLACLRLSKGRPGESFDAWLRRHGQNDRTIDRFWATVLVSALNERLDRIDFGHARKVFLDGFLRNREGSALELPIVPLGELYGTRLVDWLTQREVDVRLKTGVRSIRTEEGACAGVVLRNGEALDADFVVLAVPYDRVADLLPTDDHAHLPQLEHLDRFASSPITGVHLWFDRPVGPPDHAVLVGRLVQWVFNHTKLQGREGPGGASGEYLQVVISAAYELQPLDKATILERVIADLADLWPAVREARLERSWVVTEHGATFSVRPGVEAIRPPQRTPIDGLFLAGDWTDTGWPATMEGAVRSGYLAAEGILSDLGRPEPMVRAELPTAPLARLLLGPAPVHRPKPVARPAAAPASTRLAPPAPTVVPGEGSATR